MPFTLCSPLVLCLAIAALVSCQRAPREPPAPSATPPALSATPSTAGEPADAPAPDPSRRFVDGVAWSPSGRSFATWCSHACSPPPPDAGAEDAPCPVHVWDRASGAVRATFEVPGAHDLFAVQWSPSEALFSVSDYDSVRVWRLSNSALLFESGSIAMYGAHVYSPDETMLLWGNVFGTVELASLPSGRVIRRVQLHDGAASLGWSGTWDGSSKLLLLAVEHGSPEIWNGRTLTRVRTLRAPGDRERMDVTAMWGRDDASVVLVGTDRLVAVASPSSGAVKVLRRPEPSPEQLTAPAVGAALGADRKQLVTIDAAGRVEEWDLLTGKRREILPRTEQTGNDNHVYPAPDGRHLALRRGDGLEIASLDAPGVSRRVDAPAAADAGAAALDFLGWGEGGVLYARAAEALLALRLDGTIAWQMSLHGGSALSPDRRFLAIADRDLTVIRLADRRTITLRLRAGDGRPARVTAAGDADLDGFWNGK